MTERLLFALARLLAALPLPLAHGLGALAGGLLALFPNVHRHATRRNLELCFPELTPGERRRLERASLVETGKTLFETPRIWFASADELKALVRETVGQEYIDAARAAGHGIIFAGPHLGSWELAGKYQALHDGFTTLFRPPRIQAVARLALAGRSALGAELVPADASGVKALLKALKQGRSTAILPDQNPGVGAGVFAPFFGHQALTMTLLPGLARKSGAAVIVGWAERLPRGRGFRLQFRPMEESIYDADPVVAATTLNRAIERAVRECPTQYQWSYGRFRRQPKGVRKPY